jgi:hypothetical protein
VTMIVTYSSRAGETVNMSAIVRHGAPPFFHMPLYGRKINSVTSIQRGELLPDTNLSTTMISKHKGV